MQEMQLKEVKTAIGTLKISKSTRTEVDESKLPQSCFDVVQTIKRKTKETYSRRFSLFDLTFKCLTCTSFEVCSIKQIKKGDDSYEIV